MNRNFTKIAIWPIAGGAIFVKGIMCVKYQFKLNIAMLQRCFGLYIIFYRLSQTHTAQTYRSLQKSHHNNLNSI